MSEAVSKGTIESHFKRGAYCLANDVVIEWFEAFIRSYQVENSALPLTVIPFNGNITKLRALQKKYHFDLMDEARCARFDKLSTIVMGRDHVAGMYRKLACFFGPYDEFIFLDSDIVLTTALGRVFEVLSPTKWDLIYFDFSIDAAYTPKFAAKMVATYQSHGFNAGAFASRKALFSEKELWQLAEEAAKERDGLVVGTIDQPYWNFIMDVTRRRMARVDTLLPEFSQKAYVRETFDFDKKSGRARTPGGKLLPFVHWAGCGYPTMVRPEIFFHYRTLGMSAAERWGYALRFYALRWKRLAGNTLRRMGLKK